MLTKSFFSIIVIACMLSASATAAQQPTEMGKAIRDGVDQRVDTRVSERLTQYEQQKVASAAPVVQTVTVNLRSWDKLSGVQRLELIQQLCGDKNWPLSMEASEARQKLEKISARNAGVLAATCDDSQITVALEEEQDEKPVQLAQNVNVDADINIGNGYRRPVVGRPGYGTGYGNANLDRDLARRAIQVLGPPPTTNHRFAGVKRTHQPVPRGCRERAVKVPGGTYYRVVCN